jgi:RNA polymerase sigma-70 factor (ECF subfamily)
MKNNEAEIIACMQSDKLREKGLRMMMDAYQVRLYWHVRRLLGNSEDSKDILQDTFIKAFQNFGQFKQESKLYTWLYRIATNEALQQLNKRNKMKTVDEDADYYLRNQMSTEGTVEEKIQKLLEDGINRLPEKQKLVFNMRYYDDLPYEEISKIVDMSVGTLKTNYHYAKQKIEDFIKENIEN